MNWNLLFLLLVVIGLPFTLAWVGIWKVIQNWSGPKGYRAQAQKFWAGEEKKKKEKKKKTVKKESPVLGPNGQKMFYEEEVEVEEDGGTEEPDKVKGMKDILKEKGHIIVGMYVVTLLICLVVPVIGGFWISVAFGLVVGFISTASGEIDKRDGLKIAGVATLLSLFFESIIRAPLFVAAVMFLLLGPPLYLIEEKTRKDVFPWRMIDICLIMAGFNLFLGLIYLFGFEHSAFIPEAVGGSIAYDIYAEATRAIYTGSDWLDALKWLIAILLILLTSGPIDLAQRLKARKDASDEREKKGQPRPSGALTATRYIIYELLIGFLFRLIGRDEMGRKLDKTKPKPKEETKPKK
ncbi:MAG: hypothetical protein WCW25_05110 [Patescibacteria group bacterium]|jgi:hypothetical protein